MTRNLRYLFVLLLVSMAGAAFAQTGAISGTVFDERKEPLIGAVVQVFQGGAARGGDQTDIDGKFTVKPLNPGQDYEVRVSYTGYKQVQISKVVVSPDRTTYQNFNMQVAGTQLKEVTVITYKAPLIRKDEPGSTTTITSQQIERLPTRSTVDAVATTAGTHQSKAGGDIKIAGARASGTQYIIDGVQVSGGSVNFAPGTVDQISVVTSGIPAKYGDASGGLVTITTKGSSPFTTGQIGVEHSIDGYNHNLIYGSLRGPLLKKRIDSVNKKNVLGYAIGGQYLYDEDNNPNYFDNYVVKEDKLREIQEHPLVMLPNTAGGKTYRSAAEYITMQDLETRKKRVNADVKNARFNAKIDYQLSDNTNIVLGGNFSYTDQKDYDRRYTLFSPDNMPSRQSTTGRGFIRFSQRFGKNDLTGTEGAETKKPLISNAYYTLQADYQTDRVNRQDPNHKHDAFKYNYVGKFDLVTRYAYGPGRDDSTGILTNLLYGYNVPVRVDFTPSDLNPLLARYTSEYYKLAGEQYPTSLNDISAGLGLRNGDFPNFVYGSDLYFNAGYGLQGYGYSNKEQFAFNVDASFDLQPKKTRHAIEFGLYYQQRAERAYSLNASNQGNSIWSQMRLLANRHILDRNTAAPDIIVNGQHYTLEQFQNGEVIIGPNDTISYARKYDSVSHSTFDKNLRAKLGLTERNLDYINVDALDPSFFSLSMFSPDELINSGKPLADWYGYDYTGKRINGQVNFNDWFTKKDANGNYTREIGAFRPSYIAGYIMDKFELPNNTLFHLGMRVERFDANTKVLKDPYSLYATETAATSTAVKPFGETPSNIKSDYVVYVTDNASSNPSIIGYRNGDDWYDASGKYLPDPSVLAQAAGGSLQPHLIKTGQNKALTMKDEGYDPNTTFTDYKPQVNVMPRISFTFPIAEQSMFFAHYDVLVQRPKEVGEIYVSPVEYYYLGSNSNAIINNPDLKPEKTFDYELGFQQVLTPSSAITLIGFYKERKDMIQIRPYLYAWPSTYFTFGNRDFSTTKGFILKYDMRRVGPLTLNLAYTLQFAEGTGSSSASGNAGSTSSVSGGLLTYLVGESLPNLRWGFPLDYDSRHNLTLNLDYRYDKGEGPAIGNHMFQNTGLNFIFSARSGEPYTSYQVPGQRIVKGGALGARLPWHYMLNARLDKSFDLKKPVEGIQKQSRLGLTAFVYVTNLLNTRDILGVYGYTGRPDDDAYTSSAQGQQAASVKTNPQSYIDLYNLDKQDPNNLNNPRRINVGLSLNF
jgi:outer membrane receptor protein involved in Fe transport